MIVRYTLRDRVLLRTLMDHPGCGTPFSIRTLTKAAGLKHPSLVGRLLSGTQETCDMGDAHSIAEALGVAVLVLFAPPASPKTTDTAIDP